MITIYVDADASPIKNEAVRVAKRYNLKIYFVSNSRVKAPEDDLVEIVIVKDHLDAADDWIVEHITETDVAVTADIPLASRWQIGVDEADEILRSTCSRPGLEIHDVRLGWKIGKELRTLNRDFTIARGDKIDKVPRLHSILVRKNFAAHGVEHYIVKMVGGVQSIRRNLQSIGGGNDFFQADGRARYLAPEEIEASWGFAVTGWIA